MSTNKINNLIEKYKLSNIIKIVLLLILLFLIYRIFIEYNGTNNVTNSVINNQKDVINDINDINEGFLTYSPPLWYGNVISLNDPKNIISYYKNTCTFKLSDVFRIDTLDFKFGTNHQNTYPIKISFLDNNGNMKYIKGEILSNGTTTLNSPPVFNTNTNKKLTIGTIRDENNSVVYTSQIILTIESTTTDVNNDYITGFGIYGGDRNLDTFEKYKDNYKNKIAVNKDLINATLTSTITENSQSDKINKFIFTQAGANNNGGGNSANNGTDIKIFYLELDIIRNTSGAFTTDKPYNINISYENTLYPYNIFNINTTYIVRSDSKIVDNDTGKTYIYLTEPIIANKLIFTIPKVNKTVSNIITPQGLTISSVKALSSNPTQSEITDYKQSINIIKSSQTDENDNANICPSINSLVDTQTKTQQICDSIEYQDKVKSEKLRLERNKQYLLKLKNQQDQIDQLNSAIQDLEDKRQARSQASDQVRVLQYQKQKGDVSTIKDLVSQRLESQDNNKLYMDLNVTST